MRILYDYKCDHCKNFFSRFNTVEKRDTHECPKCERVASKVVTAPAGAKDTTGMWCGKTKN